MTSTTTLLLFVSPSSAVMIQQIKETQRLVCGCYMYVFFVCMYVVGREGGRERGGREGG